MSSRIVSPPNSRGPPDDRKLGVALDVGQAWLGNEALAGLLREMADGLENVAVN